MLISVIIGFRNRDLQRVRYALDALAAQSSQAFELIFIDYGSDEAIANEVQSLVEQYPFAQYHYSHTRGWFWNRAHALNTGIRLAKNDLLLLSDIDLVIEKDLIKKISQFDHKDKFYTFSCFYLPQNFDDARMNDIEQAGIHYEQNYVGLCAVKKEDLMRINGFDEYFMVWGAEDDDLYMRLSRNGLQRIQTGSKDALVFHQWHEAASPGIPTLWYLTMVNYLFSGENTLRNISKWGRLIKKEDRVIENEMQNTNCDPILVNGQTDLLAFNHFIAGFYDQQKNKGCFVYQETITAKGKNFFGWRAKSKEDIRPTIQLKDVVDFLQYFVGINRHLFSDYYFIKEKDSIRFYYTRKEL